MVGLGLVSFLDNFRTWSFFRYYVKTYLYQLLPGYILAISAEQCCAKIALFLEAIKPLFTATAFPCFRRSWKLVGVAFWMSQ
jgi:hypothetical protein